MNESSNPAESQLAEYHPRVRRFFAARGCHAAADDLASEVIIRVLTAIRRGEAIQHLGAYALGTARLVLLEYFRDKAREPEPLPEGWEPPAREPEEPDRDRIALLEACLGGLAPKDRDLLVEYYGDGGYKPIRARLAERLGVSLNALHVRACRLRGQVRKCVEARLQLQGC